MNTCKVRSSHAESVLQDIVSKTGVPRHISSNPLLSIVRQPFAFPALQLLQKIIKIRMIFFTFEDMNLKISDKMSFAETSCNCCKHEGAA